MLSIHDDGPWPACPAPFNLAAHVLAPAARHPGRTALSILGPDGSEDWSFARLEAAVRGTATGLLSAADPGDRVVLRLGNSPDFPVAFLGAIAAGLIPVPLSAALTAQEVAALLPVLSPRLILADPCLPLPPAPCPVWTGLAPLRDLPPADHALGDPDRPAYAVFTSGSSGRPKAVLHAHRAIWARGMMRAGWDGIGPGDRVLHAGAFNWTYTLGTGLLDPWSAGATALSPAPGTETARLPELLRRAEATVFAAVPAICRRILARHRVLDLPALRHALSAGERLPATVRQDWEHASGRPILEALGMTECSTFVSASAARRAPSGATGWPQPGRRVAVLDAAGAPVARGTPGELAVATRDPGLFLGYLGDAAGPGGDWFRTGDRAVMTLDGAIFHLGRIDDLMNAGGIRLSPTEVEDALQDLPGVAELAVAEVPVRADTTVVAGFYAAPQPLDPAALTAYASGRMASYKVPRLWVHLPALPRTATGKIDRKALRAFARKDPP